MRSRVFLFSLAVALLLGGPGPAPGQPPVRLSAATQCSRRMVTAAPATGALASDRNQIYVGYLNGTIEALSADALEINWRAEMGGEFVSNLAMAENGVVIATNSARTAPAAGETTVRLLGKESGVTAWATRVTVSERYYIGRINGSLAIVSKEGQVTLLDRSNGQILWQTMPLGALSAPPAFSSGSVAVATADKHLTIIAAHGGRTISRQATEHVSTAVTFLKKDAVTVGDERGNVALMGPEITRPVWRFKSGAGVSSIAESGEGILVTSLDNFVYLISDYNGDVIWKRRLTGRVLDGGLSVNGHFIVLVNSENAAYVMDLARGKLTDSVSAWEKDIISRVPVQAGDRTFAFTTVDSVELFALGSCERK